MTTTTKTRIKRKPSVERSLEHMIVCLRSIRYRYPADKAELGSDKTSELHDDLRRQRFVDLCDLSVRAVKHGLRALIFSGSSVVPSEAPKSLASIANTLPKSARSRCAVLPQTMLDDGLSWCKAALYSDVLEAKAVPTDSLRRLASDYVQSAYMFALQIVEEHNTACPATVAVLSTETELLEQTRQQFSLLTGKFRGNGYGSSEHQGSWNVQRVLHEAKYRLPSPQDVSRQVSDLAGRVRRTVHKATAETDRSAASDNVQDFPTSNKPADEGGHGNEAA